MESREAKTGYAALIPDACGVSQIAWETLVFVLLLKHAMGGSEITPTL